MKNTKKSRLLGLFLLIPTIIALLLGGCSTEGITGDKEFKTIYIEGCQYLYKYNGYNSGYSFVHKGNCTNPIHKCH